MGDGEGRVEATAPQSPVVKAAFDASEEKVIRDGYARFASRQVFGRDRLTALVAKIHEEVAEAVEAFDRDDVDAFVEELADVVEVCFALGGYDAVEDVRNAKLDDRGGFDNGLVMRLADRTDK